MDQFSGLVWMMFGVIAFLMVTLFVVSLKLRAIQRDLKQLDKSLDTLGRRLDQQQARLDEIRSALDQGRGDAFGPILDIYKNLRTKGLVPALTLLGSFLFRTYLSKKRTKALPKISEP